MLDQQKDKKPEGTTGSDMESEKWSSAGKAFTGVSGVTVEYNSVIFSS